MVVQRRDPRRRQLGGGTGRLPLERLADRFNRRGREAALRIIAREGFEEAPGEEMTVTVVQAHTLYRS